MTLASIIESIRSYRGVLRKGGISRITSALPGDWPHVLADFGEDAAVLEMGEDALLLAADGIMDDLLEADPYWAGYCSVLVNVNDIAAMGGRALAMVNVLSIQDPEIVDEVVRGISDASRKFGVPMVGGHTHPDARANALDVAVLGIARKGKVLYSHTAKAGESIIFGMDLDGCVREGFEHAWDTTTHKGADRVQGIVRMMEGLASMGIVGSCKDISNPGSPGTLAMLMETSGKGCDLDLSLIPRPEGIGLEPWLLMYQGFGFVMTCQPSNEQKIIDTLDEVGITAGVCGKVTDGHAMNLTLNGERGVLFDLAVDSVTGIKG